MGVGYFPFSYELFVYSCPQSTLHFTCWGSHVLVLRFIKIICPFPPSLPFSGRITLQDLKSCKMTPVFFNTFVNVDKYLDYEQRDPLPSLREEGSEEVEPSDWEKYASEQYELLIQEEQYEQGNDE